EDGTTFGIIASTTDPFCATCDRSRLTADGMWYLCLYATQGLDLRGPLRAGAPADDLRALISGGWRARADRGAEDRLALGDRTARSFSTTSTVCDSRYRDVRGLAASAAADALGK